MKKLIIFDLDGTLAESKSSIDNEMADLINNLLSIIKVAVISGGSWQQFEKQLLPNLSQGNSLKNLFILPVCGTKFYQYESSWRLMYSEDFSEKEKEKITNAIKKVNKSADFKVNKIWGESIEDRGSQITFSALGQQAPIDEKKKWDPDFSKRKHIKAILDDMIPEFSVHLGGTTSIDVTRIGIDKAYGIRKLRDMLNISIQEMIFVGDAIFTDGNDYPVKEAGVFSIKVRDIIETKKIIETIIACLDFDLVTNLTYI